MAASTNKLHGTIVANCPHITERRTVPPRTVVEYAGGRFRPMLRQIAVSAALLASDQDARRSTAVSGAPRLPYCMMGVCFDCLVTIDGVGSRQACLVPVREGMSVETQLGKREAGR